MLLSAHYSHNKKRTSFFSSNYLNISLNVIINGRTTQELHVYTALRMGNLKNDNIPVNVAGLLNLIIFNKSYFAV